MDNLLSRAECLNGTVLKIIALISMTLDHIGYVLFPGEEWLRILGRLAFPVFAYMIAEGCYYTKNKKKYLFMILLIGVICQVVAYVAQGALEMNIMFTLALSAIVIFTLQWTLGRKDIFPSNESVRFYENNNKPQRWIVFGIVVLLVIFVAVGLPEIINGFKIDYRVYGVFLPVVIYLGKNHWQKLLLTAIWLVPICLVLANTEWYSFFSLIPLLLYNGKRGKHPMKYLFYIYYPVHLGIIWGISFL